MTDLKERLEQDLAPAWRPDQEDDAVIVGEVVDIDIFTGGDYDPYPLITVRLEDGTEKAVHGMQTVLKNELIRQRPAIGERIGIKYLGEVKTKPGSRFKSYTGYKVKVEREQGAAFDWSKLGSDPEPTDPNPYAAPPQDPAPVPAEAGEDGIPF